jgi:hypothetical protein
MIEGEPTDLKVSNIIGDRVTHSDSILGLAEELATAGEMDSLTSEALQKFAIVEYLARSIKGDFNDPNKALVLYPVPERDDEDNLFITYLYITKGNFEEYVGILSRAAFGIYDKDLQTDNARAAAHKIQEHINGILG